MAKKKYSIHWDNDEAVGFDVNGVEYKNVEDIPDPVIQEKIRVMLDAAKDVEINRAASRASMPIEKIITNIFTGIAIIMLLVAGFSAFGAIRTLQRDKSAGGVVVDIVTKKLYLNTQDRNGTDFYYPVISFTAEDGKLRSVQMSTGSDVLEYEKGNEVTVLYDPQHPLDARIKSFGDIATLWILPAITGILGICFLGAIFLVNILLSKNDTPSRQSTVS